MNTQTPDHLIIFDGVCNFCNHWINFVMRNDKKDLFRFIPFQSDSVQNFLKQVNATTSSMDSVIYIENHKAYYKSSAALRIAKHLGGLYSLFYLFIIVPPFIRNFFYDLIANNRYKLYGKSDSCMIPTPEMRKKFL